MNSRTTFAAIAVALVLPFAASAAWLELGPAYVRWEASEVEIFDIAPATRATPSGPDRVAGLTPDRRLHLAEGERLFLVAARHHDPRPELAEIVRVVVDAGGELLVAADPAGSLALDRMASVHEGQMHLVVRAAPVNRVVRRRHRSGAGKGRTNSEVLAACAQVDGVRWHADVTTLEAFGTRHSRKQGIWDAAEWAKARLESLGYATAIEPFQWWGGQAPNVVARLFPGSAAEPRDMILVGAHLDSINFGNQDQAPGADDNASGSAGILEIARVLAENCIEDPGIEIRLALFSGEEQGLYGSKAMAKAMQASGELSRMRAMINLDMIAFDQSGGLDVTLESEEFNQAGLDRMVELAATYTDLEVTTTTHAWGSDHVPFLDKGIPAILPIEGEYDDNPHDHTGHDVVANLNPDLAVHIMKLVVASVLDAAAR